MEIAILTGIMILGRYVLAYDVVNRCPPSDEETWTNKDKAVCKGLVGQRYHCIKSINGSFLEMCIHPKGFQSRECPYFDPNSSSNFQYRKCNVIHGKCPPGGYYPSYHLYKYTACLYSPTTAVNSDYNTEMTQPTQSDRKQRTTTEPKIGYVTIFNRKMLGNQNSTESATIFASDILKGILTFTCGMLIASVCFIAYVIKRKKQLDLRMTYSNAVAFKDNTENIYDDIVEATLEIPNNNTSLLEKSAYLEPSECHADTSCHRVDESEKENTDMQLCDVEMEKADDITEVTEVKDTVPSLLGFL